MYDVEFQLIFQVKLFISGIASSEQRPHQISLVCLGPLTNIALALKTYPEIKKNIRDVFIMGGNFKGD